LNVFSPGEMLVDLLYFSFIHFMYILYMYFRCLPVIAMAICRHCDKINLIKKIPSIISLLRIKLPSVPMLNSSHRHKSLRCLEGFLPLGVSSSQGLCLQRIIPNSNKTGKGVPHNVLHNVPKGVLYSLLKLVVVCSYDTINGL
jgi:hypothetical protein